MMAVCCCSLEGTAACQHCHNNPMATDVWTNKTMTVNHVEAKSFGNGIDVCSVCGKPSTIGKPITNADRIRSMTDEELVKHLACQWAECKNMNVECDKCLLEWLKKEYENRSD